MLSSSCFIRACSLCAVKFLSRLLTALNLLPSMATTPSVNNPTWRLSSTNSRQTRRIASPSSFRKSAMVLKSGISRPVTVTFDRLLLLDALFTFCCRHAHEREHQRPRACAQEEHPYRPLDRHHHKQAL